jgi:feruloyl esterase
MLTTAVLALSGALLSPLPQQTACESLASLNIPNTTITTAETVVAGPYITQGRGGPQEGPLLPTHCRIAAVLAPSPDSHIEMELWMPTGSQSNRSTASRHDCPITKGVRPAGVRV